jgi:hypothetical protein
VGVVLNRADWRSVIRRLGKKSKLAVVPILIG